MIPPVARRFVAGETAAGALEHARQLAADDLGAIFNLLGEHYDRPAPARADTEAYLSLLSDIAAADLRACISVKPTQLGLAVDESLFEDNLAAIVDRAAGLDEFVWVDMEAHDTVDPTLDAVLAHAEAGAPVGVALQANLKRTAGDLTRLVEVPAKVRLVKGAYSPPPELSYGDRARVDEVYRTHLEYLFEHGAEGLAVASHDPAMIDRAAALHDEFGTPYEIQMLMGVREDAQRRLAADRDVWQYVPYGERWLSYFYRRLAERRENLAFALRALLPGDKAD